MGVSGKLVRANDARASAARASQLQAVLDHAPDASARWLVTVGSSSGTVEAEGDVRLVPGAEALGRTVADLTPVRWRAAIASMPWPGIWRLARRAR